MSIDINREYWLERSFNPIHHGFFLTNVPMGGMKCSPSIFQELTILL